MDPLDESLELRQVLVLRRPYIFSVHEQDFLKRFHILKAYESPLPTRDFLHHHARFVKVILCSGTSPITADVIHDLPALQLIVSAATGINHIDMATCCRQGIKVTNAKDVYSDEVADGAVGLLIDVMRRITSANRFVRSGRWQNSKDQYPLGFKLSGKQVGIVGLGNIGSRVATRLKAMGCIISYTSRQKKQSTPFTYYPNIIQLAFDSDALVLCCALTDDTRHIINHKVMTALGKKGVIVNVGRGGLIDEAELVKCLVDGGIGGVGLDVFEHEPNVPKELFELDNVVFSPHSTAFTKESFYDVAQVLIGNLEAFFMNKPLLTPVVNGD